MVSYTKAAMERAMKIQEVILRAMAKKITWYQAAEIIVISDRQSGSRVCWTFAQRRDIRCIWDWSGHGLVVPRGHKKAQQQQLRLSRHENQRHGTTE
jgi:hypothetical protein